MEDQRCIRFRAGETFLARTRSWIGTPLRDIILPMETSKSSKSRNAFLALAALLGLSLSGCAQPALPPTLYDEFNGTQIDASVWQVASWPEHDGQTSPDRCFVKDGYLTMQFMNNGGTFLSSAVQTWKTFLYGKWEYRAKCSSVPGVLNSFYTIDWGTGNGTKQEIDIEFLSKSFGTNKGQIHYAVHQEGRTSFQTNPDVDLGFDPSAAFHTYAIEITRTYVRWLVDGAEKKRYAYASGQITINAAYQLKLNFWSMNGGWIGGPPASGQLCTYLIDWIKFTPSE
jgi:endo-1,3-1,4-beta-glycanase ExoK